MQALKERVGQHNYDIIQTSIRNYKRFASLQVKLVSLENDVLVVEAHQTQKAGIKMLTDSDIEERVEKIFKGLDLTVQINIKQDGKVIGTIKEG